MKHKKILLSCWLADQACLLEDFLSVTLGLAVELCSDHIFLNVPPARSGVVYTFISRGNVSYVPYRLLEGKYACIKLTDSFDHFFARSWCLHGKQYLTLEINPGCINFMFSLCVLRIEQYCHWPNMLKRLCAIRRSVHQWLWQFLLSRRSYNP